MTAASNNPFDYVNVFGSTDPPTGIGVVNFHNKVGIFEYLDTVLDAQMFTYKSYEERGRIDLALPYVKSAALMGCGRAMTIYATHLSRGDGCVKDMEAAYTWLVLAVNAPDVKDGPPELRALISLALREINTAISGVITNDITPPHTATMQTENGTVVMRFGE